jgi:hypothetical protein
MKKAICVSSVPAVLSPYKQEIQIGQLIEYKKEIFRNGEHHYVLADKNVVPSIFFDSLPQAK